MVKNVFLRVGVCKNIILYYFMYLPAPACRSVRLFLEMYDFIFYYFFILFETSADHVLYLVFCDWRMSRIHFVVCEILLLYD